MAKQNLEFALRIRALVDGVKNVLGLSSEVKALRGEASKPIPDPTPPLRDGADKTSAAVSSLAGKLTGLVSAVAIKQFVDASVDEFARAEMAFRGLEAVANFTGVGIGKAMQVAEKLSADGLLTTAEASKALQNLLSRGYSIEQAEQTLMRLRDAAFFGRAAHLSLGEAVVTASEGLKNENSILVDNAGVTKNVSVLWKEYAESIGKSVTDLTQAEKVEAEHAGIMRETAAQVGNSTRNLEDYQHKVAESNAETRKFMASLGQLLVPLKTGFLSVGTWLIENVAKPITFLFASIGADLKRDIEYLRIWKDAVLNFDFSKTSEQMAAADKKHEEALTKLAGNLNGVSFEPLADSANKAASAVGNATASMGKSAKELAKEQKQSVNEQIKDYERLRDALIKAFDDSRNAQKDYLAEAKKLRAEASVSPRDDSVEGQAAGLLDLISAEQALMRMRGSAPLEDIRAQVELVQQLAEGINDQARATEAINRAKLIQADALERAAGEESQRQADIAAQQAENDKRLASLQAILKDLEAGKKVNLDVSDATTAMQQVKAIWDSITDKTVNLTVKQNGAASPVPGFATGTVLPGFGGGDRILSLLEAGEAVTNKEAVRYYGRNFMRALNARQIPRFADGGIVDRVAAAPVSRSGTGLHPVILKIGGMGEFPMMARPEIAREVEAVLNMASLKRGRRV